MTKKTVGNRVLTTQSVHAACALEPFCCTRFPGEEELLRSKGVQVVVLNDKDCIDLMKRYIEENPEVRGISAGESI